MTLYLCLDGGEEREGGSDTRWLIPSLVSYLKAKK